MRNNKEMMNECRRAMSAVAGADANVLRSVVDMRMRSEGNNGQESRTVVDSLMAECVNATEDFSL